MWSVPVRPPRASDKTSKRLLPRFAAQWAAGDVSQLQSRFSQSGLAFNGRRGLSVLSPPSAPAASIREYLENREAASARVSRTGEVGGEPPQGFAEIRWESRIRGMSEMVTRTVFVAFVYEDGVWRVAEVRVLPRRGFDVILRPAGGAINPG